MIEVRVVVSTGPLSETNPFTVPWHVHATAEAHGVRRWTEDASRFTQNLHDDIKLEFVVEGDDPDGIRWFFAELGLTTDHLAWGDIERQLARHERTSDTQ